MCAQRVCMHDGMRDQESGRNSTNLGSRLLTCMNDKQMCEGLVKCQSSKNI